MVAAPALALLALHFQNDIVHPAGAFGAERAAIRPELEAMLMAAARALDLAREAGLLVVHVAVAYRPGYPDLNRRAPLFAAIATRNALVEGSWGAAFHQRVAPQPGDLTITGRGMSAFAGTDLDALLRLHGIDRLALAGFATNGVVESTAREAVDRGYAIIVLEDGCAASSTEVHRAALRFLGNLGEVTTSDVLHRPV
jgi:nicotinamidase-related amidase